MRFVFTATAADVASGRRILGIGSPGRDGTHAEYVVFSAKATASLPADLAFEEAAALGIAGLSAWIPLVENADGSVCSFMPAPAA